MNGQVRDDIFDYGIGLGEGAVSLVEGLYNFGDQSIRHLSGNSNANWEESTSGKALSLYFGSSTARTQVNKLLYNQATDLNNYSARNIGRVTGRVITGALGGIYVNSFTGVTAGFGDGVAAVESGGDFARGFVFGN